MLYFLAGTIAGSSNRAPDTTPLSSFRNNGVAGAAALGTAARGARLYVQVCYVWSLIENSFDAFPRILKTKCRTVTAPQLGLIMDVCIAFCLRFSCFVLTCFDALLQVVTI